MLETGVIVILTESSFVVVLGIVTVPIPVTFETT
jgi:hypothetical protein